MYMWPMKILKGKKIIIEQESHLDEHFQLHPEAHHLQSYGCNFANVRIGDIVREAEPIRLLIGVTVETKHGPPPLEEDRQDHQRFSGTR